MELVISFSECKIYYIILINSLHFAANILHKVFCDIFWINLCFLLTLSWFCIFSTKYEIIVKFKTYKAKPTSFIFCVGQFTFCVGNDHLHFVQAFLLFVLTNFLHFAANILHYVFCFIFCNNYFTFCVGFTFCADFAFWGSTTGSLWKFWRVEHGFE